MRNIVVPPTLIRDERELAKSLAADDRWWAGLNRAQVCRQMKRNPMIASTVGCVMVWTLITLGGAWVGHGRNERGVDMELVKRLLRAGRLQRRAGYFSITTLDYMRPQR